MQRANNHFTKIDTTSPDAEEKVIVRAVVIVRSAALLVPMSDLAPRLLSDPPQILGRLVVRVHEAVRRTLDVVRGAHHTEGENGTEERMAIGRLHGHHRVDCHLAATEALPEVLAVRDLQCLVHHPTADQEALH